MIAEAANPLLDPWRFQAHPELWLLVGFLIGAYVYSVRVIGPQAVPTGPVVTRRNITAFVAAMTVLWMASDWPMHDLAEEYLYSMHMLQHMALSYFVPPLALLALPEWMFRALIGEGRAYRVVRWFSKPVIAGVIFNVVVMVTHIPGLVNRSASSSPLHYSLHVLVVTSALLMWIPICGPAAEFRIGYGAKMIYLFLMSIVPTVPAGWLTFAEGTVYKHYDTPVRVWGLSVSTDQQLAGAIMKLGGSIFLWSIVIFMFFKRFAGNFNAEQTYVRDTTLT
ncbi:MAG: cytochrome c oxidase assembly protein, partial [Actinomycetota bacterium]